MKAVAVVALALAAACAGYLARDARDTTPQLPASVIRDVRISEQLRATAPNSGSAACDVLEDNGFEFSCSPEGDQPRPPTPATDNELPDDGRCVEVEGLTDPDC
jgi:hypothetical protein